MDKIGRIGSFEQAWAIFKEKTKQGLPIPGDVAEYIITRGPPSSKIAMKMALDAVFPELSKGVYPRPDAEIIPLPRKEDGSS